MHADKNKFIHTSQSNNWIWSGIRWINRGSIEGWCEAVPVGYLCPAAKKALSPKPQKRKGKMKNDMTKKATK